MAPAEFWTERTAAWYARAVARSDYAERVLGVLEPLLAECTSALDVGAGCGALALPLATRLPTVTALEPAPAMANALRQTVRNRGLANVEVVEGTWEDVPSAPHDLVLCAHVGELLRRDSPFLRTVGRVARRWVAVVRDVGRDRDKFFFRDLYPALLGRPYRPGCDFEDTVADLARLGTAPTVAFVEYRSDQPFVDLEEACDFWQEYLGVSGPEVRTYLRAFLGRRLERDGAGWVAPYAKRAAVMWWPVTEEPSR